MPNVSGNKFLWDFSCFCTSLHWKLLMHWKAGKDLLGLFSTAKETAQK